MFYVVRQGDSVDQAIAKFEGLPAAQDCAQDAHAKTGAHHLVIEMRYLWTTQPISDVIKRHLKSP